MHTTQMQLHVQQSLCNTFIGDVIMMPCRTETKVISRMETAWPFDCYLRQRRRYAFARVRLSVC